MAFRASAWRGLSVQAPRQDLPPSTFAGASILKGGLHLTHTWSPCRITAHSHGQLCNKHRLQQASLTQSFGSVGSRLWTSHRSGLVEKEQAL
jgi:hypothetical protein